MPKLVSYRDDAKDYYDIPYYPKLAHSNQPLNTIGGDDILIYTNVVPNSQHIANHLSPLLIRAPCPTYMFGELGKWIMPEARKSLEIMSKTWSVETLQFTPLANNVNLDDMYVTVSNFYGDILYPGVLDIQLVVREKQNTDVDSSTTNGALN